MECLRSTVEMLLFVRVKTTTNTMQHFSSAFQGRRKRHVPLATCLRSHPLCRFLTVKLFQISNLPSSCAIKTFPIPVALTLSQWPFPGIKGGVPASSRLFSNVSLYFSAENNLSEFKRLKLVWHHCASQAPISQAF